MLVPTIDLITVSDIWSTTIQDRLVYHNGVVLIFTGMKALAPAIIQLMTIQKLLIRQVHFKTLYFSATIGENFKCILRPEYAFFLPNVNEP